MEETSQTVILEPKKKTKAEKIGMIVVFTLGPILLAFILYLYGVFSFFYVRTFNGDRISGEITVAGEEKTITPASAAVSYNNGEFTELKFKKLTDTSLNDIDFESTDDNSSVEIGVSSFSTAAPEAGEYVFDFTYSKADLYEMTGDTGVLKLKDNLHIKFRYKNEKWYYITYLKFTIDFLNDKDGVYCVINTNYFADNAERYKVTGSKETNIRPDFKNSNEIVIDIME